MNIKDFLIDNYIWIIVIILITIITIIGFLADKKKGNKKEQNVAPVNPNTNNQAVNNGMPMQYQQLDQMSQNQINNNMVGMNQQGILNQNMMMPNNQNIVNTSNVSPVVTEPQPVQMVPTNVLPVNNNPQPVENIAPNIEHESMYQPLSEQKPVIAPQPVVDFSSMQNLNNQNMTPQILNNSSVQAGNNMVSTIGAQVDPLVGAQSIGNQNSNYNVGTSIPVDAGNQMISPNGVSSNVTVPQPVNPTPIPVLHSTTPQPMMQSQNNLQSMNNSNFGQPLQQPMPQSLPNQQMSSQPVNFVYGSQNNNQNM